MDVVTSAPTLSKPKSHLPLGTPHPPVSVACRKLSALASPFYPPHCPHVDPNNANTIEVISNVAISIALYYGPILDLSDGTSQ